ncbi:tRNA (guanine-N(7)-)-methyltransferase [Moraxella macacae 0408225]|uniref:tRNA (guanine-N(7)-)-methyltransferase n=1 Tax=Moraxella macacae 0408225 TaxID=1230338 RepID=L2F613_9GAMM|nr:tRNA (guanosine(46)-N7)-methyltransferase TrmB [Moraxella macacae]ELA08472.1 tRNA (guanine-N(7)-)-methyltransferase [Moraxella macacae 0408225]
MNRETLFLNATQSTGNLPTSVSTNSPTNSPASSLKNIDKNTVKNEIDNVASHTPTNLRTINTFMKRKTHMGKKAQIGLSDAYQSYFAQKNLDAILAMDIEGIDNLRALFNNPKQPLTLEIGFGMGTSLVEMAKADPKRNFVGIEVHEAGLGNCAFLAGEQGLTNLQLISGDALALMKQLPKNHIDTVQLYFPDPWQKKRHYKRRFVNTGRMAVVAQVLTDGGIFHAATDWEHYAFWMLEVLDGLAEFNNVAGKGAFLPRPNFRPLTKFEQRGINEGRVIYDLMYKKLAKKTG